jgi:hypothetical protein
MWAFGRIQVNPMIKKINKTKQIKQIKQMKKLEKLLDEKYLG